MWRIAGLATVIAVLLTSAGWSPGEDVPGATTTLAPPALSQVTQLEGTVPDLSGRWLLLTVISIGQSPKRVLASVFEMTRRDGKLEIAERHVLLPPAQEAKIKRANDELGGVWAPRAADLQAIAAAWDTLEPAPRGIAEILHQLTARDAFDEDLRNEPTTKDALWVLRQAYRFVPGGSRPVNQANLIAPLKLEDGVYSGNYVAVAVAASVVPIPIKFDGTFRLLPLPTTAPSLWTRLGDFFAGCGGR